ncbi:hypothetical protein D3C73_1100700 [compost metagenome]
MQNSIKVGEFRENTISGVISSDILFTPMNGHTCLALGIENGTVDALILAIRHKLDTVEQEQATRDDPDYDVEVHICVRNHLSDITHQQLLRSMFVPASLKSHYQREVLIWSGEPEKAGVGGTVRFPTIPFTDGVIMGLYTLYDHTDKNAPPALPYGPKHLENAFMADSLHDWRQNEKTGSLRYYSRVAGEAVWLLAIVESTVS